VSTSSPASPRVGDMWYQTDTQLMKRYSGSSWENTGASPLEASESVGVDFENSSGNVQILSDGTLKAVNGEFSGTVHASDGEFSGTVYASDGEFSGVLEAASGQMGGFVSEDLGISGVTYTSSNTIGDLIGYLVTTNGMDKFGGAITATYNSKTYIRYERLEKYNARSIGYVYSYTFYASDGTSFTALTTANFTSDFVFIGCYDTAKIYSMIEVPAGMTIGKFIMPTSASVEFPTTSGSNVLSETISGNISSAYTFLEYGYKSSCYGVVRMNWSLTNNYSSSQNLRFKIYVGSTEITEITENSVGIGATKTGTYDLTINPEELVKFEVDGVNGNATFEVYASINETVGSFASYLGMRKVLI
jgi:hypothetical protein